MGLKDWQAHGWLLNHTTSPEEIAALLAIVDRDLRDSEAVELSADWRLNIAYNAALQAAKAALAASGFRVGKVGNAHYHTLQSLALVPITGIWFVLGSAGLQACVGERPVV